MLLNTLQCTTWPPLERMTQPRVNGASVGTETDQGRAVILKQEAEKRSKWTVAEA